MRNKFFLENTTFPFAFNSHVRLFVQLILR